MKTLMGKKETYFTNTLLEAESLVQQMKKEHGSNLKDYTIAKRQKRGVEYFIITVIIEYYRVADLVIEE